MKKFAYLTATAATYFSSVTSVLAQAQSGDVPLGSIKPPAVGVNPNISFNTLLSNAITIIFILAALLVLYQLVQGAVNWILSGGDKDAVGKARSRIVNALIGLAILAVAFFIANFAGQVFGINLFRLNFIPTLGKCTPNPVTGLCE